VIYDPGPGAQTISSQIVVLPDGALVNVLVRIQGSGTATRADVVAVRSADAGATWSEPVVVNALRAIGVVDGKTGHPVRAGEVVPSSAVDGAGRIWVAWEDARFSGGARDGIALASSADGGATWSAAVQVNRVPEVQAFRPAVAAGAAGAVAVTYHDLRYDLSQDPDHTWATVFRATTRDGGATWEELPQGGPFDLRSAPDAQGWFVGDYTGLVARRDDFQAVFSMGSSALGAGTDAFASRAPAVVPVGAIVPRAQVNAAPLPLGDRVRAMRELTPR
jgi:Neuraminidase (sialidase)